MASVVSSLTEQVSFESIMPTTLATKQNLATVFLSKVFASMESVVISFIYFLVNLLLKRMSFYGKRYTLIFGKYFHRSQNQSKNRVDWFIFLALKKICDIYIVIDDLIRTTFAIKIIFSRWLFLFFCRKGYLFWILACLANLCF